MKIKQESCLLAGGRKQGKHKEERTLASLYHKYALVGSQFGNSDSSSESKRTELSRQPEGTHQDASPKALNKSPACWDLNLDLGNGEQRDLQSLAGCGSAYL